jgi:hypothetical protein
LCRLNLVTQNYSLHPPYCSRMVRRRESQYPDRNLWNR